MIRTDTGSHIAPMAHLEAWKNWPIMQLISKSMCAKMPSVGNMKMPIAIAGNFACPEPASIGFVDIACETNDGICSDTTRELSHSNLLSMLPLREYAALLRKQDCQGFMRPLKPRRNTIAEQYKYSILG